jgi:hypothetical protein
MVPGARKGGGGARGARAPPPPIPFFQSTKMLFFVQANVAVIE